MEFSEIIRTFAQAARTAQMGHNIPNDLWYGLICLLGEPDKHWDFYETDPSWWAVRLWTRRN